MPQKKPNKKQPPECSDYKLNLYQTCDEYKINHLLVYLTIFKSYSLSYYKFEIAQKNTPLFRHYETCNELNEDLLNINKWAPQWKMSFNPDPNKTATEVIFSHKSIQPQHPTIYFNNFAISSKPCTKHLGIVLDSKLNFHAHLDEKITKANKGIGMLKRLQCDLSRRTLLNVYKLLDHIIRPLSRLRRHNL